MSKQSAIISGAGEPSNTIASCDSKMNNYSSKTSGFYKKRSKTSGKKHSGPQRIMNMRVESGSHLDHVRLESTTANANRTNSTQRAMAFCNEMGAASYLTKVSNQVLSTQSLHWKIGPFSKQIGGAFSFEDLSREQPKILSISKSDTVQKFKSLALSREQIIGLESLGFNLSKLMPQESHEKSRVLRDQCEAALGEYEKLVPLSFQIHGVPCYVCKSPEHVAYGMGFILEQDTQVIAVEVGRDPFPSIYIATSDVVLIVPTDQAKALRFVFRNPEIIKIGTKIEEKLDLLWRDLQIDSATFLELSDLSQLRDDGMTWSFDLRKMAYSLGYPKWKRNESQGHQAVVNSLMITHVFWGMVKEYGMCDGRIDLQLVNSLCTHLPISTILEAEENQREAQLGFCYHPENISTSSMSISSGGEDNLSMSSKFRFDDNEM